MSVVQSGTYLSVFHAKNSEVAVLAVAGTEQPTARVMCKQLKLSPHSNVLNSNFSCYDASPPVISCNQV